MMTVLMIILFFLLVLMMWSIAFTLHRKLGDIEERLDDIRSTLNKDDFGIEQANEIKQ
jgi:hypothetical protein